MSATLWSWTPEWADGIEETLAWLTEVLASPAGVEQCRALRRTPRRSLSAEFIVEGRERAQLDLQLHRHGAGQWLIPIWPDVNLLSIALDAGTDIIDLDTAGLDYQAGGQALLRGDSADEYELLDIEAVEDDRLVLLTPVVTTWPVGARLYPERLTRITQMSLPRLTDRDSQVKATFTLDESSIWPAWSPETLYLGYPVLEDRPDETEDLTHSLQRLLLTLDNDVGLPLYTDTAKRAFDVRQHRWLPGGREERARLRSILYYLRGRQRRVWVPTHAGDLVLAADITAGLTFDVEAIGLSDGDLPAGRRHIRIETQDGRAWHRRIVSATAWYDQVERIEIDAVIENDYERALESGEPRMTESSEVRMAVPVSADVLRMTEDGQHRVLESGEERLAEIGAVVLERAAARRISFITLCRGANDEITINHDTDSLGVARCDVTFQGTHVLAIEE